MNTVTAVALPPESGVTSIYPATDLADAFAIQLPAGSITNPEALARFIFTNPAPWITSLMTVRDAMVAGLGLKTTAQLNDLPASEKGARVGIFKIYSSNDDEIILGEDDKHLDFRVSLLRKGPAADGTHRLVATTVVQCHNRLGRAYIFVIAPFHRAVVKTYLRRAAQIGWPRA
jgi:hypothetical protein